MSKRHVSKPEFQAKALAYFREVEASGDSVIVTDLGKPVIEVRPYRAAARNPLDVLRGSVLRYDRPTEPVDIGWEAAR